MTKPAKEVKEERPQAVVTVTAMAILEPIGTDEAIVAAFKRYVALKEKLLEETDYTWFVVFKVGEKETRKGFSTKDEADKVQKDLEAKKVVVRSEKKIKKSGAMKLAKAFGISHEILERVEDAQGIRYLVKAIGPNGQYTIQTGRCGREEMGRKDSPMHHLDGTALTRAKNRATMDLLGGETTAEELEDVHPLVAAVGEKIVARAQEARGPVVTPIPLAAPKGEPSHPTPSTDAKEHESDLAKELDAKFGTTPAATDDKGKQQLIGRLWAALKATGLDDKVAEERLRNTLKTMYGVESVKSLTEAQLVELTGKVKKAGKS